MKSGLKTNLLDLIIIMTYMVIFSVISIISSNEVILFFLGIPFIFIVPGYLLITAMYPRKHTITLPERIALTIGLSFILLPSIGLLLNFTPLGIQQIPVMASIVIFSGLLCTAVYYQRLKIPVEEQFLPLHQLQDRLLEKEKTKKDGRPGRSQLVPNLLAVLIIVVMAGIIFMLYIIAVDEPPGESYTELIILDGNKNIVEKPFELDINDTAYFTVVVANHEGSGHDYVLRVRAIEFTEHWTLNETAGTDVSEDSGSIDFNVPLSVDVNSSYFHIFSLDDGESLEQKMGIEFQDRGNYQLRMELFSGNYENNDIPDYSVYIIILVD